MKSLAALASVLLLSTVPAMAGGEKDTNATAIGTGVGIAKSNSESQAVAISGTGGAGGKGGNSKSSVTVNNPSTVASTVSGTTTSNINQHVSGTQTIKSAPSMVAPGLTAAGLETCLGSVSAGASVVGVGATFGTTIPDPGCAARLDARTLWSMGMRSAAVARLCLTPDIYRSMPDICARYTPVETAGYAPAGYAVAPAAAPVISTYMSASAQGGEASYNGGPVEVVVQRTGEHRTCQSYDVIKHRCRAW